MKASYSTIGLMLLAAATAGCDNISEEERYIPVEKPIEKPTEKPTVNRTLLIMEFTGNRCSNCPNGAKTIELIKEDEGSDRVISVGLHPTGNPYTDPLISNHPSPHKQDFRCEAATALYEYYQPAGFPAAVFEGTSMSTSIMEWQQIASEAIAPPSFIDLSATCNYDKDSRKLTVDYTVDFVDEINAQLNVTVWLVENKILGTQTMPSGSNDRDYEHNHVLRASLNGNWGENIGESFIEGSKIERSASMTLNEDWVAENCDVVVYVYRDSDKYVEQATSISIMNDN